MIEEYFYSPLPLLQENNQQSIYLTFEKNLKMTDIISWGGVKEYTWLERPPFPLNSIEHKASLTLSESSGQGLFKPPPLKP